VATPRHKTQLRAQPFPANLFGAIAVTFTYLQGLRRFREGSGELEFLNFTDPGGSSSLPRAMAYRSGPRPSELRSGDFHVLPSPLSQVIALLVLKELMR